MRKAKPNGAHRSNEAPTRTVGWRRAGLVLAAAAGVGAVAAGCTSSAATPSSTTVGRAAKSTSAGVVVSAAHLGTLGTVLVDGTGFALYRYTADVAGRPSCTGACAAVWPPLTLPSGGKVVAGAGLDATLFSVTSRSDGTRQVTFAGLPLYRYRGDTKAGQANGQGVGGTWFTVPPAAATTPTSSTVPPTTAAAVPPSTAAPVPAPTTTAPPATSPPTTAAPPPTTTTTTAPPSTTTTTSGGGGYGY
ncbi:MAG: hypothetical protein JO368_01470 [Acidimicrobiales bacterium]|nr:hypothetical protein [Acidimicrobiales bacterium]